MPLSKDNLERQLTLAKAALDEWTKNLETNGIQSAQHRRDPKWRSLNANCRRLRRRLARVEEIRQRDADAEARRAETANAES
jgi:hypothetical protein